MVKTRKTDFAPAERDSNNKVKQQARNFRSPSLGEMLNTVPQPYAILNKRRQVVIANRAFDGIVSNAIQPIGKRLGEIVGCVHSNQSTGGCGTTVFCQNCGAAKAMLKGLSGETSVEECRITRATGDSMDLRVWTTPIVRRGSQYCSLAIQDISDEKRRRALERIFFHDVLNSAGALQGATELLADLPSEELPELALTLRQLSKNVVEEIVAQRELAAAETGDLAVAADFVSALNLVRQVVRTFENHSVSTQRRILVSPTAANKVLMTDRTLLHRVLGNMLKNALEASPADSTVTIDCACAGNRFEFSVHNTTFMPESIQHQLFQRSFSTKGAGRGLGTYSMKLLTERYLGGTVGFFSDISRGTTFTASLPLPVSHGVDP